MYKVAGMKSATEAKTLLRDLEDRGFGRSLRGQKEKSSSLYTLSTLNINLKHLWHWELSVENAINKLSTHGAQPLGLYGFMRSTLHMLNGLKPC
jgi:hypothetical protein